MEITNKVAKIYLKFRTVVEKLVEIYGNYKFEIHSVPIQRQSAPSEFSEL